MKIGLADTAFLGSFKAMIPDIEVIKDINDVIKYDLIIFPGGEDINPKLYNYSNRHSHGVNDVRDKSEIEIFLKAFDLGKRMLGVCRGHQLIAALCGCSLIQDIAIELGKGHAGYHQLSWDIDDPLFNVLPKNVNSLHHQGTTHVPNGFKSVARHGGVIEILRSKDDRILTVQFHPEFMESEAFFKYVIKDWASQKRNPVNSSLAEQVSYAEQRFTEGKSVSKGVAQRIQYNPRRPSTWRIPSENPTISTVTSTAGIEADSTFTLRTASAVPTPPNDINTAREELQQRIQTINPQGNIVRLNPADFANFIWTEEPDNNNTDEEGN